MHQVVSALANSLSFGKQLNHDLKNKDRDAVGSLAHVYEVARNALEYRANHLVKRAAIERILRREIMFSKQSEKIAEELLQELYWARYINEDEKDSDERLKIEKLLDVYLPIFSKGAIDKDWLLGLISAEIEDVMNNNPDYGRFTNFAFHKLRKRVELPNVSNPDLILLVALDKIYAQSDEAGVAYHLYKLIKSQNKEHADDVEFLLSETLKYYKTAEGSKWMPKMSTFVRRQMGPLILFRDMYFSNPDLFHQVLDNEEKFKDMANSVLGEQLSSLRKRMNTANVRSLIYVFLTKMLVVVILEAPAEALLGGKATMATTIFNIIIPVLIMWLLSFRIKLPDHSVFQKIISETWKQTVDLDEPVDRREILTESVKARSSLFSALFYIFYVVLFLGIFSLIGWGLELIGFTFVSKLIFLFFLSVVTFFAYRIKQFSLVYTYNPKADPKPSLIDLLMLPIVVVGGWMSKGISRLNFLVFLFDFILESPFKTILRFLDSWFQFLSVKKDEAVG